MSAARVIAQPGAALAPRVVAVEARGGAFRIDLAAGASLLENLRRGFAAAGFASGAARLDGVTLAPFAYVIPAPSPSPKHAAFYSETFRPVGVTRITAGALTFGQRDGAPAFHAHALWREADGRIAGGHVLPDDTIVSADARIEAFGLDGAAFVAVEDDETGFTLFEPRSRARAGGDASSRAFALRLKPNQDFAAALEDFCAARGIAQARVWGGVGSTVGARFDDAPMVEPFATEGFVRAGRIAPDGRGRPRAALDLGLVDLTGAVASGRLARGANPILMTFELVLVVD